MYFDYEFETETDNELFIPWSERLNTPPITKIEITDEYRIWLGTDLININSYDLYVFDLDNTLYLDYVTKEYKIEYEAKLKNFLTQLKNNNKKLAIASHNSYPYYRLNKIGIFDYFDYIIGEYPRKKSNMINEILEKLVSADSKSRTIFFDDLVSNFTDCTNNGIQSILVNPKKGINFDIIKMK
jgi:HAD superfamily phosphatase (TIGR01681 family)